LKCEYGVENCFGEIDRFKPRYLIIIDAALFENGRPGDIIVASEESISEVNLVLSTHNIPLTLLIDLMKKTWRLEKIYVIGIYPKSMDLGLEVSLEVSSSIERLVEEIKKCIRRERRMEELV
jgi:hydrogenase maturation protease